jgi:hypothetical protein
MAWAKICETIRPCDRAGRVQLLAPSRIKTSAPSSAGFLRALARDLHMWQRPTHLSIIISEQGLSRSSTEGR